MPGITDKSLGFGMQNFFFVAADESDGTYSYYGYTSKKGSILISKVKKDLTESRYYIGTGVFATIWAGKGTLTYKLPNELKDPTIA